MIVCLCHRVSDRDITRAVQSGIRCFEVLQDETRVASSCGCCLESAREIFDSALQCTEAHEASAPAPQLPASLPTR